MLINPLFCILLIFVIVVFIFLYFGYVVRSDRDTCRHTCRNGCRMGTISAKDYISACKYKCFFSPYEIRCRNFSNFVV